MWSKISNNNNISSVPGKGNVYASDLAPTLEGTKTVFNKPLAQEKA